jgi:hypothetical protein
MVCEGKVVECVPVEQAPRETSRSPTSNIRLAAFLKTCEVSIRTIIDEPGTVDKQGVMSYDNSIPAMGQESGVFRQGVSRKALERGSTVSETAIALRSL